MTEIEKCNISQLEEEKVKIEDLDQPIDNLDQPWKAQNIIENNGRMNVKWMLEGPSNSNIGGKVKEEPK